MSIEDQKVVTQNSSKGRLIRFLFNPPPLGPWPSQIPALVNRFAERLVKYPPDLVTRLGMIRSNAYYAAGCPVELCDHVAARDLWRVIYQDVIGKEGQCH